MQTPATDSEPSRVGASRAASHAGRHGSSTTWPAPAAPPPPRLLPFSFRSESDRKSGATGNELDRAEGSGGRHVPATRAHLHSARPRRGISYPLTRQIRHTPQCRDASPKTPFKCRLDCLGPGSVRGVAGWGSLACRRDVPATRGFLTRLVSPIRGRRSAANKNISRWQLGPCFGPSSRDDTRTEQSRWRGQAGPSGALGGAGWATARLPWPLSRRPPAAQMKANA